MSKRARSEGGHAANDETDLPTAMATAMATELASLLGALADAPHGRTALAERAADEMGELDEVELARLEAELASPALQAELASHRALVSELRALPERAPSPNWRELEAKIRQGCDEVPVQRRWSWQRLREAWRLPTLGLGAAVMASLALLLWQRAPRPVEEGVRIPDATLAAELPSAAVPLAVPEEGSPPLVAMIDEPGEGGLYFDDELVLGEEIDERGVGALMQQLPDEAAITLGLGTRADASERDDEGELDEVLLPGGSFDDELDELDAEALHELDQWLEAEQKG